MSSLYHVTSRGDRREDIYVDDEGRVEWLKIKEEKDFADDGLRILSNEIKRSESN